ncbi:MAG: ABA4-like family protein [Burkholderiales bacterium]
MTPAVAFEWVSPASPLGFLLLALALVRPAARLHNVLLWLGGRLIPILLCAVYAVLLVRYWGSAPGGGFGSLDAVATLFAAPGKLLGGWVHYLAFDLLIARWIVDDGLAARLPRWLLLPCLIPAFLYGPVGLLLYLALRTVAIRGRRMDRQDLA